jgi:hypothetical protein
LLDGEIERDLLGAPVEPNHENDGRERYPEHKGPTHLSADADLGCRLHGHEADD